ncbi:DMT family transporter [Niveispirillum sp. KHB5.9]|uniref:DMT family transporter n=1 Tax=Niveispirillum sp. KHB5.9 TaxID=3400269 RepID=UPI003A88ABE6
MRNFLYLAVAILAEVAATLSLKASDNFTRPLASTITVVGYGVAFYCLSLALRTIPTGIAYAIWSGVGIVLVSAISWIWFKQTLDLAAIAGLALIVAGVLVINLFSKSIAH